MYQYTFANNLCKLCETHNITKDELAEHIGKSSRQVSRYRSGQCSNITLSTLEKIADVFQIHISELFK